MKNLFFFVFYCSGLVVTTSSAVNLKNIWKNPFSQNYQEVTTRELACPLNTTLEIAHDTGDITITSWKKPKIVVEATKKGEHELVKATKLQLTPIDDTITITSSATEDVRTDYHILAPESVNLSSISTQNGSIKIKHIKGPIKATTQNGDIEIINATKTVIAQTTKGNVTIKQLQLPEESTIIIDVSMGNVELSLSAGIKAEVNLQAPRGTISSEQKVVLCEKEMQLSRPSWDALTKNVTAKLGNGGPPITVKVSQRGDIALTEY